MLTDVIVGKKFVVEHISLEELEKRKVADPPSILVNFLWEVYEVVIRTDRCGFADANLNEQFPDVRPTKIEAFLREWWAKAD